MIEDARVDCAARPDRHISAVAPFADQKNER